ncbi:MAG: prephenate dehydrogenase [Anaerolineales bacterium]|jgi:prephenate dehydrogenase
MDNSVSSTGKVAIIGMGQRGLSLGLALSKPDWKLHVVGYDRDPVAAKRAKSLGAVERMDRSLRLAVDQADLTILAIPYRETREVLTQIAPYLKDDSVIFDTSPLKTSTLSWAEQILPPDRHWVGGFLIPGQVGAEASASLYEDGFLIVVAPPGADGGALELAARLSSVLGAAPFFFDAQEFDGLMAGVESLPSLLALACYRTIAGSPGWRDASLLAGSIFERATSPLECREAQTCAAEIVANRESILRRLDMALEEIGELRRVLTDPDAERTLVQYLSEAEQGRARWLRDRERPARRQTEPAPPLPSGATGLRRLFDLGGWFQSPGSSSARSAKDRDGD